MNLQEWRKISFQLAADLHSLQAASRDRSLPELAERAEALRLRVEERRFTVAVVGDFRRGKSTFINALLGTSVLPSDIAPTTATVNRVTYGSKPSAELRFWDGRPAQQVPIGELHEHVTKLSAESAERALAVREAIVRFPVRFCRNDVDILDTPGLGDEATMTAVTLRELPAVDAAIMVIMADSPFSESEGQFLDRLFAEGLSELIFVVSAIDRIRRVEDRQRVITSVRERVQRKLRSIADARHAPGSSEHAEMLARVGEPKVFGVSALNALEGRERHEAPLIEGSGMIEFEAGLETFLTRADHAGLARRLEQTERLAADLALALTKPPPATASPAGELARLTALIRALESATETQCRRNLDGEARATAGVEQITGKHMKAAQAKLREAVAAADPSASWPTKYAEYASNFAEQLRQVCESTFAPLVEAIEAPLIAESARHAEGDARVEAAAGVVLRHVGVQIAAIGGTAPAITAPKIRPPPRLVGPKLPGILAPPAKQFEAMLNDPALLAAMQAQSKKTAIDNLFSLDFGGVTGCWVSFVSPEVGAICQEHWKAVDLTRLVREALDAHSEATRARFEPVQTAVRSASGELLSTRERAAVHRDRSAAERAQAARDIESLRLRLAGIRAHLTD